MKQQHCCPLAAAVLTSAFLGSKPEISTFAFAPPSMAQLFTPSSLGGRTLKSTDGRKAASLSSPGHAVTTLLVSSDSSLGNEGEWSAFLDEETTGLVYYFNVVTGESRWEPPTATFPVPELRGWRERQSRRKLRNYRKSAAWARARKEAGNVFGGLARWIEAAAEETIAKVAVARKEASLQLREAALAPEWRWRGYYIHTEVILPDGKYYAGSSNPPAALLVHGFGASTTYWRTTAAALSGAGFEVHALDLLGQGKSDKPTANGVEYSIRLWAALVDDYARKFLSSGIVGQDIYLMGHSLGSLVVLAAASGDHVTSESKQGGYLAQPGRVSGICLFNCGIGMNSRGIVDDTKYNALQRTGILAVFAITDALVFDNPPALRFIIEKLVTPDLLRFSLRGLYKHDPSRVDEVLVESFYRPSREVDGAVEAVRQIYTNDPGLTPMDLYNAHATLLLSIPTHLVWGKEDDVTPLTGSVGRFYASLAESSDVTGVTLEVVRGGHVPFDDNPEESNGSMLRWLEKSAQRGETGFGLSSPRDGGGRRGKEGGWLSEIF